MGRTVSVVVPARDEERTLPALLASLDGLPVAEVVVVDDDSSDGTAAVAAAAGARVVVAARRDPRAGPARRGPATPARRPRPATCCSSSTPTRSSPRARSSGCCSCTTSHGGLVSVQPHHRVVRAYEQLSAYFNAVALMASAAFTGRRTSRPMAFGPCLLTSRDDYERVGGHRAVRGEILDDVRLARAYDRAGLPVTCVAGGESLSMRSYPGGLAQLVAGWTQEHRLGRLRREPARVAGHRAVDLRPPRRGRRCADRASSGVATGGVGASTALWALAWLVAALQLRGVLRAAGTFRWWTWALFPLPLLAFDLVFARSALLTVVRRSVRWRGRPVDLRRQRAAREVA